MNHQALNSQISMIETGPEIYGSPKNSTSNPQFQNDDYILPGVVNSPETSGSEYRPGTPSSQGSEAIPGSIFSQKYLFV